MKFGYFCHIVSTACLLIIGVSTALAQENTRFLPLQPSVGDMEEGHRLSNASFKRVKGVVNISSEPTGAKIFLDGNDTGKVTPYLLVANLGEHELRLEKPTKNGLISHNISIKINPELKASIHITEFEPEKVIHGMVFINGGCFDMGDIFGEGDSDEKPVHEVCVDNFYIGEHEVTQGEWEKIMGNNPSYSKNCGSDCPVENVSWHDAQKFIRNLTSKTGLNYRLPTEAEWEYAAREGGKRVRFGTGKNIIDPDEANFDGSVKYRGPYANPGIYRKKVVPVKSFAPNSLGLYDMSGNVWEWCADWYYEGFYSNSQKHNPMMVDSSGNMAVIRGGSWLMEPMFLRAANRGGYISEERDGNLGFRLARQGSPTK